MCGLHISILFEHHGVSREVCEQSRCVIDRSVSSCSSSDKGAVIGLARSRSLSHHPPSAAEMATGYDR